MENEKDTIIIDLLSSFLTNQSCSYNYTKLFGIKNKRKV